MTASADPSTLAPMTIEEALRAEGRGGPWRIRLAFVGANPTNASGRSDKWWEATSRSVPSGHFGGVPGVRDARTAWGKNGAVGQSKQCISGEAFLKAREKLAKGYVYDSTVRAAAPAAPVSLQALVNSATWRPIDQTRFLLLAGEHGFVALDLDLPATLPNGSGVDLPVRTFLAADGGLWGLVASKYDKYDFCRLRI